MINADNLESLDAVYESLEDDFQGIATVTEVEDEPEKENLEGGEGEGEGGNPAGEDGNKGGEGEGDPLDIEGLSEEELLAYALGGDTSDDDDPQTEDPENEDGNPAPESRVYTEEEKASLNELLSNFGIPQGIVTFAGEDGTTEEYNVHDLDPESKVDLLYKVIENAKGTIDKAKAEVKDKHNLTPQEEKVLLGLRKEGATLDKVLEEEATKILNARIKAGEFADNSENLMTMNSAQIFQHDFIENLPKDAFEKYTNEQISEMLQEEYDKASKSELFEDRMAILKQKYIKAEEDKVKATQEAAAAKALAEEEAGQKAFVDATRNIKNVGVFDISDKDKEEVYQAFFTKGENGLPKFLSDAMEDPVKAFELIHYGLQAKERERKIIAHYEAEKEKAIAEAVKKATKGYPETKPTGNAGKPKPKPATTTRKTKKTPQFSNGFSFAE